MKIKKEETKSMRSHTQTVGENEQGGNKCEQCNQREKSPKYDPCCSYFCWTDKFN